MATGDNEVAVVNEGGPKRTGDEFGEVLLSAAEGREVEGQGTGPSPGTEHGGRLSGMEETMKPKVLRQVVAQRIEGGVRAAMMELTASEVVDPERPEWRVEAEHAGPVTGVGSCMEFDVRARDKGGPMPDKGERPWHYYRVTITEHETAR